MSVSGVAIAQPLQAAPGSLGVVAVDVDEVLCRYCEAFVSWVTGKPAPADPGACFQICYQPTMEAARAAFLDTQAFVEIDRVAGSLEGLRKLQAMGFDLQAVTARPAAVATATERYLAKYFPGIISAVHIAQAPYKGSVCRTIGARVLIDDQLANAYDAAQHGVQAIVFDAGGQYTWNHTPNAPLPPNVVRKYDWAQTVDWIVQVCRGAPVPQPALQLVPALGLKSPLQALQPQQQMPVPVVPQPGAIQPALAVPAQMHRRYIVPGEATAPPAAAAPPAPVVQPYVAPPPVLPVAATTPTAAPTPVAAKIVEMGSPRAEKRYPLPQASVVEIPRHNENAAPPNGHYGYPAQTPQQPSKPPLPPVLMAAQPSSAAVGPAKPVAALPATPQGGACAGADSEGAVFEQTSSSAGAAQAVPVSTVVRRMGTAVAGLGDADALEPTVEFDATPVVRGQPVEIVIEAIQATGFDVTILPKQFRYLSWRTDERQSFMFGRQSQFDMLAALVPDDFLRNFVSRQHFELVWQASALYLKKLTPNIVLVDGACAPGSELMRLGRVSAIGFCGPDGLSPFLQMQVKVVDDPGIGDFCFADARPLAASTAAPSAPSSPKVSQRHVYQAQVPVPRQALDQPSAAAPVAAEVSLHVAAAPAAAALAPEGSAVASAAPADGSAPSSEAPLVLSCIGARGLRTGISVDSLDVPRGVTFRVGRHQQPEFFEKVLGSEPRFLGYVSRSHLELMPLATSGLYQVKNLSINPIVVDGRQLDKGEQATVHVPANVDFVAGEEGVHGAVSYLSLRLERVCVVRAAASASAATAAAACVAETSAESAATPGAAAADAVLPVSTPPKHAAYFETSGSLAEDTMAYSPLPGGLEAKLMESPLPGAGTLPLGGDQLHLPQMQQCSA